MIPAYNPDFGTDISALPQLNFSLKTAYANLAEAIGRRLITPRGGLFYDPDYGFDLRRYLNETWTESTELEVETLLVAELRKDPRIFDAVATIDASNILATRRLSITIEAETDFGPFSLVLDVSAVTVEVLYADLGGIATT